VASGATASNFAGLAPALREHVDLGPAAFGYTRREPLEWWLASGWNYPLQIACWNPRRRSPAATP